MKEVEKFDRIAVSSGSSLEALVERCGFGYIDSLIKESPIPQHLQGFTPWLITVGKCMDGQSLRNHLRPTLAGGWKLAEAYHHVIFNAHFTEVQNEERADPIVSLGTIVTHQGMDRVFSTHWYKHHPRSLYTYFDDAKHGPLVRILVVKET